MGFWSMLGRLVPYSDAPNNSSEDDVPIVSDMAALKTIDKARWFDLMSALQSIAKLQRAATRSQIDASQKKREASFKQEDVWIRDSNFMAEIQRLGAQGKLQGFEELSRLAVECQASRDLLGPLTQENIEAETRWQGHMWTLREAEEDFCAEFEMELREAASAGNGGEEASSFHTDSDSDTEGQNMRTEASQESHEKLQQVENLPLTQPMLSEEPLLPHLAPMGMLNLEETAHESDLDSGYGDIDRVSRAADEQLLPSGKLRSSNLGPPQELPKRSGGLDLHYKLIEGFSTRRDRINKWLEYNALQSPLEASSMFSILQARLAMEDINVPSNWAQLIIAFWDLDPASSDVPSYEGADTPKFEAGDTTSRV